MALYNDPVCLSAVSKDAKGELKVTKQQRQTCKKPKCQTLKVRYRLRLRIKSHKPCDKNKRLDGSLEARLVVATDKDGHGRGIHDGRFLWLGAGATKVSGRMQGTTNNGTHRNPLMKCERCDARGHMEGVLNGRIIGGPLKGCRVTASYMINYDPGKAGQNTSAVGTIEGVVICKCK